MYQELANQSTTPHETMKKPYPFKFKESNTLTFPSNHVMMETCFSTTPPKSGLFEPYTYSPQYLKKKKKELTQILDTHTIYIYI